MIFLEALLVGVLFWHVISEFLHRLERQKLEDRLMARNFQEFKYYEEQFPKELKVVTKAREKEMDKIFEEKEVEDESVKKFKNEVEEDWSTEAIDSKKLMEVTVEP